MNAKYLGWMIILAFLFVIVVGGLIAFFQMKFLTRELIRLVQFNTAGAGPMQRLIPNVCYLLLFLLLFGVTGG